MTGQALADAIKADQLWRAAQVFPILEVFFFIIAITLTIYVVKKYVGGGQPHVFSPARFIFLIVTLLGFTLFLSAYWGLSYAAFAFTFSAGILLSFVDPVAAVAFLIANLLMRPWEMSGVDNMGIIPKLLGGLALFSWVFHAARSKRLSLLINGPSRLFYLLALWFLISAMASGDFMAGLTEYSNTMMISAIIFILVTNVPQHRNDLDLLEKILVLSIAGSIAHALLVTIAQDGYSPFINRLEDTGLTGNSNDLAALIVQALPIAFIPAILSGKSVTTRLLALLTAPILLLGLLLSQSRGAMIAVVLSIVAYFVFKARNRRRAIFVGSLFIPVMILFYSALNLIRSSDDLQGSTESRSAFLRAGLNMGIRNPLMGVGFGNFPNQWQSYSVGAVFETGVHTAHNSWVLDFAETGLPGLILLVWLFISTFKRAVRIHPIHPELLAALVGYAVAMTFLSHTYAFYPYLLFALILAAGKITPEVAPADDIQRGSHRGLQRRTRR